MFIIHTLIILLHYILLASILEPVRTLNNFPNDTEAILAQQSCLTVRNDMTYDSDEITYTISTFRWMWISKPLVIIQ